MSCIVEPFRKTKGGCNTCEGYMCPHRIELHGLDDEGGRTAHVGIPFDYRHLTLDNSPVRDDQERIYEIIGRYTKTFARHMDGGEKAKSLYLWSESPGTGKTTTAVAILNTWLALDYIKSRGKERYKAVFIDLNDIQVRHSRASRTNDEQMLVNLFDDIDSLADAEFAVVDDIGVRDTSDAFRSYIHSAINERVTRGLPTIYTSNLPINRLADVYDERFYDRVRDQCVQLHFEGESKRGIRR